MELLHRRCCGLDVHKETVVACLRLVSDGKVTTEVRTFKTTTADLLHLSEWLAANGCTHVAMEATGVYWKPVWERRETDERQRVRVPYDEGLANRIDPESCAGGREAAREALTGARVGQPLSDEKLLLPSADALHTAEGNTDRRDIASADRLGVVVEPGMRVRLSFGNREVFGLPLASRAMGRAVKAGGRRLR
jgi:hypothetical protein